MSLSPMALVDDMKQHVRGIRTHTTKRHGESTGRATTSAGEDLVQEAIWLLDFLNGNGGCGSGLDDHLDSAGFRGGDSTLIPFSPATQ